MVYRHRIDCQFF